MTPKRASHCAHSVSAFGSSSPYRVAPSVKAGETASSSALGRLAIHVGDVDERLHRRLGVVDRLLVAAAQGAHGGRHQRAVVVERLAAHAEHELGVGRRTEVVDLELAHAGALVRERDALGVPERRRGVDAAREQRRDRLEADADLAHLVRIAAVAADDRAQHRVVGGEAGDADALALEIARPGDPGLCDDRRERDLDEGHDADHVAPLLASEGQVVDVEDRELRAPPSRSLTLSVEDDGAWTLRSTPSAPSKSRCSAR